MSCDELSDYESDNAEELTEKFIEKYRDKYDEFVMEQWEDHQAGYADYLHDMYEEQMMEDRAMAKGGDQYGK